MAIGGPLDPLDAPDHSAEHTRIQQELDARLLLAGGTVTGPLNLTAAITAASQAVNRGHIDARFVIGPAASVPASLPDGSLYFGF